MIEHVFVSLELLAKRRRELDAQEAAWLKEVAEFDRSGDWRVDGFLNAAAAIRTVCRMNHGVARGYVELARKFEDLPEVAAAFGSGEISRGHAVVIATAYTPERADAIASVEAELVKVAREHPPRTLSGFVRYLTDAIDGDGGAASDDALHERRRYHVSSTLDGMLATDGMYDPEAGEIHRAALAAEMARDHINNDPRTPAQRRADAHTNIMRRALDRAELGETHGVRPHITLTVDLDELPGATPELVAHVRNEARRNGHLSAVTLERLTCDCDISRVITTGRSEVLDVGRATRTIPPAIWKALVVRDRHCQAVGCDRPPDQCEAHHIVHWERGGPTSLEDLRLLCWNHHRQQHTHDAQARAA